MHDSSPATRLDPPHLYLTSQPWEISKIWGDRVFDEFMTQGDREKAEGLPVTPNMGRDTKQVR
jgi:hypothetical protein